MVDEDTVLQEAMEYLEEAGQRIRATQSPMRSEAGIGVNTVNRIELNETEPHMSIVRKLAAALGVEPRRLTKKEG